MLTFTPQSNLRNAREYFEKHLVVGDYYSRGQEVPGEWMGVGAERLGLVGTVGKDEFVALCENLHPVTGDHLTPLRKTTRQELDADGKVKEVANRRLFYDVTISPPKSVSTAALVKGDGRIVESHDRAVRVAMRELERFAATRVRRDGRNDDRDTGELVTAIFRHDTSRAVDPQLHSHCIVFNATFDEVEGRWKALQATASATSANTPSPSMSMKAGRQPCIWTIPDTRERTSNGPECRRLFRRSRPGRWTWWWPTSWTASPATCRTSTSSGKSSTSTRSTSFPPRRASTPAPRWGCSCSTCCSPSASSSGR